MLDAMHKVYVSNVPSDTTEAALRQCFAACGGVSDVEILPERRGGKARGLATVTMTSPSFVTAALALDGTEFEGSVLRVTDAPIRGDKPAKPRVNILQQYRDKASMTYDLDCMGLPLTLRISATDAECMIEARSTAAADAIVAVGTGTTRAAALADVVRAWNEASSSGSERPLDGEDLLKAMREVRAV